VEGDQFAHVHVGEGVAHDRHERLVEGAHRGEPLDPSGRPGQPLFAGKVNRRAVYLRLLPVEPEDGVGQVVYVGVDLLYARSR
jgi:hypothetical protein